MASIFRWSILWTAGIITSLLFGYFYGLLSLGFDMFLVFPMIVASGITGITVQMAITYRIPAGYGLLLVGCCFGVLAYTAHLVGGLHAFSQQVHTQAQSTEPATTIDESHLLRDAFLRKETSVDGLLGYTIYNLKGSISVIPQSQPRASNYVEGSIVEVVKLGILIGVCGVGLREITRVEAQNPRQQIARQATPNQRRQFLTVVLVTMVVVFAPLIVLLILLAGYP